MVFRALVNKLTILAESAQKDGNLITPSLNLLESNETVLNQLIADPEVFNSKLINDSLTSLERFDRKTKSGLI